MAAFEPDRSLGVNACVRGILEAAANQGLAADEVASLRSALEGAVARSEQAADEAEFRRLLDEAGRDALMAAKIEKRNALLNRAARAETRAMADAATNIRAGTALGRLLSRSGPDPSRGLEAILVGINMPLEGGKRSIDAEGQRITREYIGGLFTELKAAGLLEKFLLSTHKVSISKIRGDDAGGRFVRQSPDGIAQELRIAQELEHLADKSVEEKTGVTGDADALKIAKIVRKYQELARTRENDAGAFKRQLNKYITSNRHSVEQMRLAGRDGWIDFLLDNDLLDREAMFEAGRDERARLETEADELRAAIDRDLAELGEGRAALERVSAAELRRRIDGRRRDLRAAEGKLAEIDRQLGALDGAEPRAPEASEEVGNARALLDGLRARLDEGDDPALQAVYDRVEAALGPVEALVENINSLGGISRALIDFEAGRLENLPEDMAPSEQLVGDLLEISRRFEATGEDARANVRAAEEAFAAIETSLDAAVDPAVRADAARRAIEIVDGVLREVEARQAQIAAEMQAASQKGLGDRLKARRRELERQRAGAERRLQAAERRLSAREAITRERTARAEARNVRGAVDDSQIRRFLGSAYDAITSGERLDEADNDVEFAFKGPQNVAKKRSASRLIKWRDAEAWQAYNMRFGAGNLVETLVGELTSSAQSTALMRRLGPNARANFERVRSELRKEHRNNPRALARLGQEGEAHRLNYQFAELDGSVNIPANVVGARVSRNVRAITTMASLGAAALSQMSDLGTAAFARTAYGRPVLAATWELFGPIVTGLRNSGLRQGDANGPLRLFADSIGVGLDSVMGDVISRMTASDSVPGSMSKTLGLYFKLNLMGPLTDAVKRGVGIMAAHDFAREAGRAFDQLPDRMQYLFRQFGVGAAEWDVIRQRGQVQIEGNTYVDPRALRDLGEGRVADLLQGLIIGIGEVASPTPGARERALLRRGLPPGDPMGEAVRFFTQFKAFPTTIMSRLYGQAIYGAGGGVGALAYLAAMATLLGMIAMDSKEMAKGRESRILAALEDPDDNASVRNILLAGKLQGGGFGIMGDFLFGEANRFGGGFIGSFAGPVAGRVGDVVDLTSRALRGDSTFASDDPLKDFGGDALRAAKSWMPFQNLFYAKAAFEYFFFFHLQEMVNSGYLRRMERRVKRENNQEYFIPPSSVIERGGGFRDAR